MQAASRTPSSGEIAETYGVLSGPAKRASYDAQGFAGLAGATAEDLRGGISRPRT